MDIYEGYHIGGMHIVWWFIWMILLLWVFATPYHVPGHGSKKETPLNILKNRFASGKINKEEYLEKKELLQ
jgi:putative membrane protein